jgi:hypothetical protein
MLRKAKAVQLNLGELPAVSALAHTLATRVYSASSIHSRSRNLRSSLKPRSGTECGRSATASRNAASGTKNRAANLLQYIYAALRPRSARALPRR